MNQPPITIYVVSQGRYDEHGITLVTLDINTALAEFNLSPQDSEVEAWENDVPVRSIYTCLNTKALSWYQHPVYEDPK